jgi:hypothetical protein
LSGVEGHRHLAAADPVMAALIHRFGELSIEARRRRRPRLDAYGTLLRSVVGQQLSSKAAATTYGRVLDLFGGSIPTAAELLEIAPDGSAQPTTHCPSPCRQGCLARLSVWLGQMAPRRRRRSRLADIPSAHAQAAPRGR